MSSALKFLHAARMELDEAFDYYERQETGPGVRFDAEVFAACDEILSDPLRWRERTGGCRRINLSVFPYYIIYLIRPDGIFIAAIAHSSRHPDYWKSRVK
jgi:plasmid stabilization system protein ParE